MTHPSQPPAEPASSPPDAGPSPARLAFLSRLGVLLFWLGVLAGGALAPGRLYVVTGQGTLYALGGGP